MTDLKLIVITSSDKKEDEAGHITRMLEMGLPTLHMRKPKLSTGELRALIREIPSHFHSRIIIHSHHNLVREFDLKGIHVTRLHKKRWLRLWLNEKLFRFKGKIPERSCSFRKLASLYEEKDPYTHVFLSPVFDSLSGSLQSGFNEFSLRAALAKTPYKVIARGGIELEKLEKVAELGFAGLAFYSAIWKKKNPAEAFEKILRRGKELEIRFI
ncbi:MAG: thiamine phosphate synthase [Bacteroidia bacterium]|nr:thiamine phosphate synthase [Bacteroidia bacterium]